MPGRGRQEGRQVGPLDRHACCMVLVGLPVDVKVRLAFSRLRVVHVIFSTSSYRKAKIGFRKLD